MNVLGVHYGHDSGAAIVVDGQLVADVSEERFSRIKHDNAIPVRAIQCCLDLAGLGMPDIDLVAVPTETEVLALNDLLELNGGPYEQRWSMSRRANFARRLSGRRVARVPARRPMYSCRYPLAAKTELVKIGHHLAHAASAYYTCGYSGKQLIVTLDGVGDDLSGAVWRGEGGKIEPLEQFASSGSLGWFYSNVTEALGWAHGDGEGTIMGLAAYGDAGAAAGALEAFYPRFERGALVKPHRFAPLQAWNEHGAWQWHSEEANRIADLIPQFGRENLAAEAQRVLEEQVAQIVFPWLEREGTSALCCSGGVFLNVKLNQRIWASDKVREHHIYPNPSDAGLAGGAALYGYWLEHPDARIEGIRHLYLGPEYSSDEVTELLKTCRLDFSRRDDIPEFAAQRLAENQSIAWFQGRMESGPRALGSRSILMNPGRAENKDYLNDRVKLRENFRPYCPSLPMERVDEYLQQARAERFMMTSFDVHEARRASVPAVVHVDGTVRPQTVEREVNPRYWDLIEAFAKLTGEHMILNTSFNRRGEPIICHPRDAIRAFYDTGLDCLIIGDHVLTKSSSLWSA